MRSRPLGGSASPAWVDQYIYYDLSKIPAVTRRYVEIEGLSPGAGYQVLRCCTAAPRVCVCLPACFCADVSEYMFRIERVRMLMGARVMANPQVRIRPTPSSPLDAAASPSWTAWTNDVTSFDSTWPTWGVFATTCSCQVRHAYAQQRVAMLLSMQWLWEAWAAPRALHTEVARACMWWQAFCRMQVRLGGS